MWDDDLDSEEYERLYVDYDYPQFSSSQSAKTHHKHASDEEFFQNTSHDFERYE